LGCLIAASIETENKAAARSFTSVFQHERIEESTWTDSDVEINSFAVFVVLVAVLQLCWILEQNNPVVEMLRKDL
jgi:hypothetical protein